MEGCGKISALVVGLQGRFAEAEGIVKADLPADEAAQNVAYLQEMLNRKDGPRTASGDAGGRQGRLIQDRLFITATVQSSASPATSASR